MKNKDKYTWSKFVKGEENDENEKWIKLWFTGYVAHHPRKYIPPLPIFLIALSIILIILLNQLNEIIKEPLGMISFIILIMTIMSILMNYKRIKIEEYIFLLMATGLVILGMLMISMDYKWESIWLNVISTLIVIIVQIKVNCKTKRNIHLKIIEIENIDYEREIIFFEDIITKDIYFIIWDLGQKLKIGNEYKIDVLQYNQYNKEKIDIKGKQCNAYHIKNINKDYFFKNLR